MFMEKPQIQSGFTVMEFILVIAIMAAMAAVAIPGFMQFLPGIRLNGAARQVMSDLMDARMEAVKQNNQYKFFVLNDRQYKILDDNDNDGNDDGGSEVSRIVNIQNNYSDVTLIYDGSPPTVAFSPKGTAPDVGTITVQNSSGTKSVKVSIAGRVKIE